MSSTVSFELFSAIIQEFTGISVTIKPVSSDAPLHVSDPKPIYKYCPSHAEEYFRTHTVKDFYVYHIKPYISNLHDVYMTIPYLKQTYHFSVGGEIMTLLDSPDITTFHVDTTHGTI